MTDVETLPFDEQVWVYVELFGMDPDRACALASQATDAPTAVWHDDAYELAEAA